METKIMISTKVKNLSSSVTIAISSLAAELKANGEDVLAFSAGEPDFDTPQVIKDEAIKAINDGDTKYTAVDGTIELRNAIVAKLKKDNNLRYDVDCVLASVGAKHSLFNLFQTIIEDGDEVIIPAPYWVTYPEQVKYSGGIVIEVKTREENDFKITAQELKKSITNKTKALILTTPSNPTGSIYSKDEIVEIEKVLRDTDILVISDEMYEKLIYDNTIFTSVASVDGMFDRTIIVNGLSKSVAMTGWRFGYFATTKKDIVKNVKKLQSQSTSNICSITQRASIIGLNGEANSDIEAMRVEFETRRDFACELFCDIEKLSVIKPKGAFYLFVNITKLNLGSMEFCKQLLEKKKVAVVPGVGFGMEGYFRFSFATDKDKIDRGIKRIRDFVESF
jgi:aspartate aminotransferase